MGIQQTAQSRLGSILTVAGLLFVNVASAVNAHTILIKSDPVANSTIKRLPEMITLTFDAPLTDTPGTGANSILVTDPMNMTVSTSENVVKGATLSNVLNPPMVMDGIYHVRFRVVSNDGHPVTGDFVFHVDKGLKEPQIDRTPIAKVHHGVLKLTASANGAGVTDAEGSFDGYAEGKFILDFDNSELCSQITTKNLDEVLAIHIHSRDLKSLDVSDEILLPVDLHAIGTNTPNCLRVDSAALNYLASNPSNFIMMLHTKKYPTGAVGGSLTLADVNDSLNVKSLLLNAWVGFATLVVIALLLSIRASGRKRHTGEQ
jgi:methionine-rich copper-binding protein CopC